jgi:phosphatidylserine/phosphatidylglycerophosphate/cardiolipin synthase-like enzyme
MRKIQCADHFGKTRFCFPVTRGRPLARGRNEIPINLHSKIIIVDDDILQTGSSNLSNRSLRMDTECDVVLSSQGDGQGQERVRQGIRSIRDSLLAEHLGVPEEQVSEDLQRLGSLIELVDRTPASPRRRLARMDCEPKPVHSFFYPALKWIDPANPE